MTHIKFDSSALKQFVHENELGEMQAMVNAANDELRNGSGAGADFRDWLHLPTEYDKEVDCHLSPKVRTTNSNNN